MAPCLKYEASPSQLDCSRFPCREMSVTAVKLTTPLNNNPKMAAEKRKMNGKASSSSSEDAEESEDCGDGEKKGKKSGKETTVYSNASKQG